jgi:5-hydroxyisourate hydrolase
MSPKPGKLSTHVLDTMNGRPAAGVEVELAVLEGSDWRPIARVSTNADGRTDAPLLAGDAVRPGRYRLTFAAGDYFRRLAVALPDPPFVDQVTIDFGLAEAGGSYHVPLLVSPWSYSTYRGS